MTLVSLGSPTYWPGIFGNISGGPAINNSMVTPAGAGHYGAYVICAHQDMTISHVGFRVGNATGSPTAEVRIETVDASGLPSGTLWATDTNGTTGTLTANSNVLQALTASASVTKGQVFCVKVGYASGTSFVLQNSTTIATLFVSSFPYQVINTGSPTKGTVTMGLFALGSSSTTFYNIPGLLPLSAYSAGGFNNTNSAKRGLKFTIPFNCRAIGVRWYNSNSSGDYNIALFDNGGTPAELGNSSTAIDGDYNAATANAAVSAYFDNAVSLTAGTTYRLVVEPTSATNVNVSTLTLVSSDYFSGTPAGANAVYTSFASSSWTDSSTQLPLMDLIIDQVDNGSGTGGVVGVIGG